MNNKKPITDNKISNLGEQDLINLINRASITLLKSLEKYLDIDKLKLFKTGKVPLNELGICNGITTLIDKELQAVHKEICILDCDTFTKFKKDIERDF